VNIELILSLLAAAIQSGTPILYATLGEILTERAGILNLGVEGMMMAGALGAFLTAQYTGSPVMGFVAGGVAAAVLAALHGTVCLVFLGNQVVSGLALTILGTSLTSYLGTPYVGQTAPGFTPLPVPLLSTLPIAGPVLFSHDLLVYASYVLPLVMWGFFRFTRWGLNIRAAGENPDAVSAAGLPVSAYRWAGVLVGGFFVGLGGAYLSLAYTHLWAKGLSAGRGWIAVALVIFAFWHPGRAAIGAYLFGGVMAFQLRLQALGANLPSSLLLMLPYGLTVLVLVASSFRRLGAEAPAVLGITLEPPD